MIETFVWTEKYTVRVKELNEHHKKLFELMNLLHNMLLERRGKEIIADVLNELFDYTDYHFAQEEQLMEQSRCNGIVAHKAAHQEFVETLQGYKEKVQGGLGAYITTNVMVTLNDWLINHIGRMDRLYGDAMNEAGIS